MKHTLILASLVLTAQANAKQNNQGNYTEGAPFITVGADNACNHSSIQDAIDNGLSNTIRVASNKNYFESLQIFNKSKNIIGGYADCSQAATNITDLSQAIITSTSDNLAVLMSNTAAGTYNSLLRNLVISNGIRGISATSQNTAETVLTLNNVRLFNNDEQGLQVSETNDGQMDVIVNNSLIDFNNGSGITCSGESTSIKITGQSIISNNETNNKGGGINVVNGCLLEVYSPTEVRDNKAGTDGGGIHVFNAYANIYSADFGCENGICFGDWSKPVIFADNSADTTQTNFGSGGAINASGSDTEVTIYNAIFDGNESARGGAFSVKDSAQLTAVSIIAEGNTCFSQKTCLQIKNNKANSGGMSYVSANASLYIGLADISNNRANTGVVALGTTGALTYIYGSTIHNNGNNGAGAYSDDRLFYIFEPNTRLNLDFSTIVDNDFAGAVISNANGQSEITSSIIFADEDNDVLMVSGNAPSATFECLITHESDSFSAGGTILVKDPNANDMFVNPLAQNYHLKVGSAAIDYCYDALGNSNVDSDFDNKGTDNADVADLFGVYDIGSDEFSLSDDIIFKNEYEFD